MKGRNEFILRHKRVPISLTASWPMPPWCSSQERYHVFHHSVHNGSILMAGFEKHMVVPCSDNLPACCVKVGLVNPLQMDIFSPSQSFQMDSQTTYMIDKINVTCVKCSFCILPYAHLDCEYTNKEANCPEKASRRCLTRTWIHCACGKQSRQLKHAPAAAAF